MVSVDTLASVCVMICVRRCGITSAGSGQAHDKLQTRHAANGNAAFRHREEWGAGRGNEKRKTAKMPGIDFLLFVRHEAANEIGDFIGGGVEGGGAFKPERSVPTG